jgi:hypothetical protein
MRINTLGKVFVGAVVADTIVNGKEGLARGCMGCVLAMALSGVMIIVAMAGLWGLLSMLF